MAQRSILLVFPEGFHLGWMGATNRIMAVARALNQNGWAVFLLASRSAVPEIERNVERYFPGRIIRTNYTGDYPLLFDLNPLTRRAWRATWKAKSFDYYAARLSYGWAGRLSRDHAVLDEIKKISPAVLWGISAGYLGGACGASLLAERLNVPWILELQDPPLFCDGVKTAPSVATEFCRLLQHANKVITLTKTYKGELLKLGFIPENRIECIYYTFDESAADLSKHPLPVYSHGGQLVLLYAGWLSGSRTLKPLIDGLYKAVKQMPEIKNRVVLKLVGGGPGFKTSLKQAHELGLKETIIFLGAKQRDEVIKYYREADALIVIKHAEPEYNRQIPGKLFDCLALKKPIIGIMASDTEAAFILKSSGLGFIFNHNDAEGIANFLITLYKHKKRHHNLSSLIKPDYVFIEQFSEKALGARINDIMEEVIFYERQE